MPFGAEKTRMVWLPDGEKMLIRLFVLTQLTNVTDTHTQTPHHDIGRTYASHSAAKTGITVLQKMLYGSLYFEATV